MNKKPYNGLYLSHKDTVTKEDIHSRSRLLALLAVSRPGNRLFPRFSHEKYSSLPINMTRRISLGEAFLVVCMSQRQVKFEEITLIGGLPQEWPPSFRTTSPYIYCCYIPTPVYHRDMNCHSRCFLKRARGLVVPFSQIANSVSVSRKYIWINSYRMKIISCFLYKQNYH